MKYFLFILLSFNLLIAKEMDYKETEPFYRPEIGRVLSSSELILFADIYVNKINGTDGNGNEFPMISIFITNKKPIRDQVGWCKNFPETKVIYPYRSELSEKIDYEMALGPFADNKKHRFLICAKSLDDGKIQFTEFKNYIFPVFEIHEPKESNLESEIRHLLKNRKKNSDLIEINSPADLLQFDNIYYDDEIGLGFSNKIWIDSLNSSHGRRFRLTSLKRLKIAFPLMSITRKDELVSLILNEIQDEKEQDFKYELLRICSGFCRSGKASRENVRRTYEYMRNKNEITNTSESYFKFSDVGRNIIPFIDCRDAFLELRNKAVLSLQKILDDDRKNSRIDSKNNGRSK